MRLAEQPLVTWPSIHRLLHNGKRLSRRATSRAALRLRSLSIVGHDALGRPILAVESTTRGSPFQVQKSSAALAQITPPQALVALDLLLRLEVEGAKRIERPLELIRPEPLRLQSSAMLRQPGLLSPSESRLDSRSVSSPSGSRCTSRKSRATGETSTTA
jgi:hypothetical protein